MWVGVCYRGEWAKALAPFPVGIGELASRWTGDGRSDGRFSLWGLQQVERPVLHGQGSRVILEDRDKESPPFPCTSQLLEYSLFRSQHYGYSATTNPVSRTQATESPLLQLSLAQTQLFQERSGSGKKITFRKHTSLLKPTCFTMGESTASNP